MDPTFGTDFSTTEVNRRRNLSREEIRCRPFRLVTWFELGNERDPKKSDGFRIRIKKVLFVH